MKKALLYFMALFALGGVPNPMMSKSYANTLEQYRETLPEKMGEWVRAEEDRFFDDKTIFDYIDGAGELYRAYHMQGCFSRRYANANGNSIIIDIFDMGSPEDAFGIFTHDLDGEPLDVGQGARYRSGWLSFWKDRYFVSIYVEEETPSSRKAVGRLAHDVDMQIPKEGELPELLLLLPAGGLQSRSIRYLHTHEVLNSHYYLSDENILLLGPNTNAALAEYEWGRGKGRLLLIMYPDKAEASRALARFHETYIPESEAGEATRLENGKWAAAAQKGAMVVIALEADSQEDAEGFLHQVGRARPVP